MTIGAGGAEEVAARCFEARFDEVFDAETFEAGKTREYFERDGERGERAMGGVRRGRGGGVFASDCERCGRVDATRASVGEESRAMRLRD